MQIEEGAVVSGKVTGLTDFGAFVELEGGKTGMIHISEVAPNYVKDIREHLSVGQEVTSKVISITPQGKISLSIKKLNDQPKSSRESADRSRGRGAKSAPHPRSGTVRSHPHPRARSSRLRI